MATNSDTLLHIFNHLFLPPKLPQQDDYNARSEASLLSITTDGLIAWKSCTESAYHEQADAAISTIRNMQQAHSAVDGYLNENEVLTLLTQLTENAAIPLYAREQNAGVLISKNADRVLFEVFEISPTDESIMATKGRLRRSFPGAAVALYESDFQNRQFQETIAHTLAEMSKYPIEAVQPKVKKAGSVLHEDRDTNHPGMVSELFIGFLRSIGEPVSCPAIVKNMRDDVLWADARSPWRRSPSWLLVRVALQLGFNSKASSARSHTVYKEAVLFVLSHTLTLATKHSLSSEVIFSMSAKLSRRLLKIGPGISKRVLLRVQGAMESAYAKLSERWSAIQKQNSPKIDVTELSNLNSPQDCYVSIPELDDHITWMAARQQEQNFGAFQPPSTLMIFPPHDLPRLPQDFTNDSKSNAIANLEAFETWVALHCRKWARDNQPTACSELGSLIVAYHCLALLYYRNNPEAHSAMLLTVFELWVACDETASDSCPLLRKYDPDVPLAILQNLLLPFASQMQRLCRVEQYLVQRSSNALFLSNKLYYDLESPECFPVQYFGSSEGMQKTYREIMEDAQTKRAAKQAELHNLKREYHDLVTLSNRISCEYEDVLVDDINYFYDSRHKPNCTKCIYESEATSLEISIDEWPLPQSITKAKSVVFEKQIPSYLQSWRQARFYLMRDVVGMRYSVKSSPRMSYTLASDPHLPSGPCCSSHIGLLSQDKAQVVTHRRAQKVSTATESSVCVNNGLNYRYFDSVAGQFVEPFEPTGKVLEMCTYHLPMRSETLQRYLYRPATFPDGPGPNIALADQSETPTHMSVEEARDLAMLPLGHRIQLHNILIQLAAPSLNFKKEETAIFVLQCLYQSGPPGDTPLRASHAIIDDEGFAFCLLVNLTTAWHRIKENWESAQALGIFAAVTARLLSFTSSKKVQQSCIKFLGSLRTGAFAWVELLRDKSHEAVTQDDRAYLRSKSVDVALICVSCFDVEEFYLHEILKSDSDASIFVQCSIIIQEGNPEYNAACDLTLACLDLRFRRLLYRSLPILSTAYSGISDAVQKCWSSYRPGGGWEVVSTHWLVSETMSDNKGVQSRVHYNLLSGELLVNGVPLSRPPREYEEHPMWRVLFGRTPIEVMPTSATAMEFSAKRQYRSYDVRFGKKETSSGGSDLLVQASRCNVDYETIPSRLLHGKFPDHFINGFVHWYNHTNGTLEFRPRETPWDLTESTWVMSRSSKCWTLESQGRTVLGTSGRTATAIANVLLPLADKPNIHVILRPLEMPRLEVELPALRLGFFLTTGESSLRSREFPGMSIDSDQSLTTLTGFANKLILKGENLRLVLVPEGQVSWESANGHIHVTILKASIIKVHALCVDSVLGRLTDNGNLQCKLFLSYLHALTSYCLPDSLTNRTGVEQALSMLNSAAVRSFDRLSQQNIDTLVLIAQLCPTRQYYPQNKRVMQTASWVPNLSFLSHHGEFYEDVREILEQAIISTRMNFSWAVIVSVRPPFGPQVLALRSIPPFTMALIKVVIAIRGQLADIMHAPQGGKLWRIMLDVPEVFGPDHNIPLSDLRYSAWTINSGLRLWLWPALHKVLSTHSAEANKFNIMIWLSALAAHEEADIGLLQVLALFFTANELRKIEIPNIQSCYPSKGYVATSALLKATICFHVVGINSSPEAHLRAKEGESRNTFQRYRKRQYASNENNAICTLAEHLLRLWPRETLPALDNVDQKVSSYVKLTGVEWTVRQQFKAWFDNLCLVEYLQAIEKALSCFSQSPLILNQPEMVASTHAATNSSIPPFVSVRDLFAGPAPTLSTMSPELDPAPSSMSPELDPAPSSMSRLVGLLDVLKKTDAQSRYQVSYIEELQTSMRSLQEQENTPDLNVRYSYPVTILRQHLNECKRNVDELFLRLVTEGLAAQNSVTGLWHGPRLSPLLLLQQLSNKAWKALSPDWRVCITRYGLALTALQRAERLFRAASSTSDDDFVKELNNIGHSTWDPLEHPEWLLLEVESGILIRDVQVRIALEMINPRSNCNAILQLNMGEGKSSVIVPMVAAELANGSQLARVIVGKPQSKQMAQMLTSKVGGLLNRRVYYMPFSRALKLNSTELANRIHNMLKNCENNGGILLVQPEHLLSFQLMVIECYCDKGIDKYSIAESFARLQDFFDKNSRDIVDESDENFSPKFELVYTMGSQQSIELSPARWICTQQVLNLVRSIAADIAEELPKSIEIDPRDQAGFPRLRILKEDAGELLVKKIARRICDAGLDGFPIARQQEHVRDAVFRYISQYNLSPEEISIVEKSDDGSFWTESTKPLLLLIRGILAGGVLTFALSRKRWRVDYGLVTNRIPSTKLAVPYRAKDNPTPRSEFSHPDVVIVLTSLTYYYGGLEDEDLFIALSHLMESDQATIEYDAWVKDIAGMPESFRQLEGINLKDRPQCINHVFPYLKYGKCVIDYFLGHIVFPKEVKEFPFKLSASGWDLGKRKSHYTTGFSGTNDSRKALPLDMKHLDLPSQSHTNALVLEHLLQPENSVFLLPDRPTLDVTDAQRFLDTVVTFERPVRVILDVGAQILELNNREIAQRWLHMTTDTDIQATVFVNDDDELSIIDREGSVELLQTSSYATRLDTCLVFLDQAHTRGIDLRLPSDYRAAVTLGANLTKDRLVQACMRLRKLGRGQSVVFCVSAEIRDKIQRVGAISSGADIGIQDVLHWAISETFADTERSMPLWAAQGARFLRQKELWNSAQANGVTDMSHATAKKFLDNEAQPIEARYRPRLEKATSVADILGTEIPRMSEIEERWNEFDHLNFNSSTLEEEQERELSPEIEQEREIQRPDPAQPAHHSVHPDVTRFVNTGNLTLTSSAYMPAFHSLCSTSAAEYFKPSQLSSSSKLFVTNDFARTVDASNIGYVSDSYQRPVQWILSSCAEGSIVVDVLMIISPFEAEQLMPRFQSGGLKRVTLHLYKPRCLTGHRSFDQLDFFTTPTRQPPPEISRAFRIELNLFSGQLYFDTYAEYLETCDFLGLAADVTKPGEVVDADGYILRGSDGKSKFDKSPVQFLKVLTSKIRRNGQDISKTHAGRMLNGKILLRSDFEG
ncbi:hypothetical protein E0Z10_g7524 [Xylaria hypoxylon]|uniref:ubiquitinyl hydrolase 1 n=1 Tax=Xylaria hypoxylon TaxID=37992 RepID=A0A4Z0YDN0_9PEZI|nr:hypothetical protein E0Z10_g7524 [Xylaria hypoxylon]